MTKKAYLFDAASATFIPLSGGSALPWVQPQPPNAPTGVTHSALTTDGWTTTWTAPATGSPPDGYRVYIGGVQIGGDIPASSPKSLTVSGQAAGTYSITVKSYNAYGVSAASTADSVTLSAPPVGVPNAPTGVTNTLLTADGWTTNWVAPSSGAAPTGYRVFVDSVKYGGDLPSTQTSLVIAGQTAGSHNVWVKAFNATGPSVPSSTVVVTISTVGPPGLTPGKCLAGWYAGDSSGNNDFKHASVLMDPNNTSTGAGAWWQTSTDGALTIPSTLTHKYPMVTKQFFGSQMTNAQFQSNLADADRYGWFLCQTTKVVNGDWAGVAAGNYDSYLAGYAQIILNRIAQGKPPIALTYHHEPYGKDINGGTRTYQSWANMHIHCSYFMAGWRKASDANKGALPTDADAVYHPELDTRAGCSWICIPNGFLFTGAPSEKAALDQLMPAALITAFNANHGVISPDMYDLATNGKRLHDKVNALYNWCSQRGAKYAGITEFGTQDPTELPQAWAAVKSHMDIIMYVVYWNSGVGAQAGGMGDMRLVPNGYPADTTAPAGSPEVGPGTSSTQQLMLYWRDTAIVESAAM